jgi:adenylosuccinate synthase
LNPEATNLIGSGCVVHVPSFFEELEALEKQGLHTNDRIFISDRCHLVFDVHQICDGLKEVELGGKSLGTTKKGIGPTYSSKASRSGIRVHHLFDWEEFERRFRGLVVSRHKRYGEFEYDVEAELERYKVLSFTILRMDHLMVQGYSEKLREYVVDAVAFMQTAFISNQSILVEGANALMLDLDFGTYPYVTSSSCSIGGVCTGLGIPPQRIQKIIGVVKAYTTRVGAGPFPTEQLNVHPSDPTPS